MVMVWPAGVGAQLCVVRKPWGELLGSEDVERRAWPGGIRCVSLPVVLFWGKEALRVFLDGGDGGKMLWLGPGCELLPVCEHPFMYVVCGGPGPSPRAAVSLLDAWWDLMIVGHPSLQSVFWRDAC